jgi:isoleucyl-tRNA synthetase
MTDFPSVFVGKTDFPLRPDPLARAAVGELHPRQDGDARQLLDGPPYANGRPHLGHVLNKHLKDAMARAWTAQGHQVRWRPGWDCHGLPLELAVEAEGADRRDRVGFLTAARAYAQRQVQLQAEVFEGQGWQAQWDHPWRTMDPAMEAGTLRVLARLLDRGQLAVRHAAVPWCAQCQSTLSLAEQEERSVDVDTWLTPFALEDGQWLLSWTTTPWTLPLHRGLFVHPQARYVALLLDGHTGWVSEDTAQTWAQRVGATVTSQVRLGASFLGQSYRTPWSDGQVLGDGRVLPQAGTGVLHAVPGLASLDTVLGQAQGWDVVDYLQPDGTVAGSPCEAQNQRAAGEAVDALTQAYAGWPFWAVLRQAQDTPHCWRHKTPLLTRPSRQVFLVVDDVLRTRVQRWVAQMEFTPEASRARLLAAVDGRPDWCLSRQRTWGVPMALYLDATTGQPHENAADMMRLVADAMEHEGVEAWWNSPDTRWTQGQSGLERVDDVLDVWFDSGCVPALLGHSHAVVEGVDQFRGWFQSCLWVAAALGEEDPPFDRVVAHGFVVDGQGRKLSKSTGGDQGTQHKGQVVDWNTLPTDVVRTWALAGAEGSEKAWSTETLAGAKAAVSRWRGVMRFLLANRLEVAAEPHVGMTPWDHWWAWQCQVMAEGVVQACAVGATGEAVSLAVRFGEEFSAVALGSWKDRMYCAPPHLLERQQLDLALRYCLGAWWKALSVLAPRLAHEAMALEPQRLQATVDAPEVRTQQDVASVLAMRQALAGAGEALARERVPPAKRVVGWAGAPAWPDLMVADALDAAQLKREGDGSLSPTEDPVCPRCRRAQPAWEGTCCQHCQQRCA